MIIIPKVNFKSKTYLVIEQFYYRQMIGDVDCEINEEKKLNYKILTGAIALSTDLTYIALCVHT